MEAITAELAYFLIGGISSALVEMDHEEQLGVSGEWTVVVGTKSIMIKSPQNCGSVEATDFVLDQYSPGLHTSDKYLTPYPNLSPPPPPSLHYTIPSF